MAKWIRGFDDSGTRYSCLDDIIDFLMDAPSDMTVDEVIRNLRNIRNTPLSEERKRRV